MSAKKNIHGLSRDIPKEIERKIRENSGFGCVICGSGITEYEHVIPEYKNAKTHDSDKITLLCHSCHGNVTRGIWSKEKVLKAMLNPRAKEQGFSNGFFDLGQSHPIITFAGSTFKNTIIPIRVCNVPMIEIKPPEDNSPYFRLSAHFYDSDGINTLKIVDNQWISNTDSWDIKFEGRSMTIREAHGHIALILTVEPPNKIIIQRISMLIPEKYFIDGNKDVLKIKTPDQAQTYFEIKGGTITGGGVGIDIG